MIKNKQPKQSIQIAIPFCVSAKILNINKQQNHVYLIRQMAQCNSSYFIIYNFSKLIIINKLRYLHNGNIQAKLNLIGNLLIQNQCKLINKNKNQMNQEEPQHEQIISSDTHRKRQMFRKVSQGYNNDLIENYMLQIRSEKGAFNQGRSFSMKNLNQVTSLALNSPQGIKQRNEQGTNEVNDKVNVQNNQFQTILELASVISSGSQHESMSNSEDTLSSVSLDDDIEDNDIGNSQNGDDNQICSPIEENLQESNQSSNSFEIEQNLDKRQNNSSKIQKQLKLKQLQTSIRKNKKQKPLELSNNIHNSQNVHSRSNRQIISKNEHKSDMVVHDVLEQSEQSSIYEPSKHKCIINRHYFKMDKFNISLRKVTLEKLNGHKKKNSNQDSDEKSKSRRDKDISQIQRSIQKESTDSINRGHHVSQPHSKCSINISKQRRNSINKQIFESIRKSKMFSVESSLREEKEVDEIDSNSQSMLRNQQSPLESFQNKQVSIKYPSVSLKNPHSRSQRQIIDINNLIIDSKKNQKEASFGHIQSIDGSSLSNCLIKEHHVGSTSKKNKMRSPKQTKLPIKNLENVIGQVQDINSTSLLSPMRLRIMANSRKNKMTPIQKSFNPKFDARDIDFVMGSIAIDQPLGGSIPFQNRAKAKGEQQFKFQLKEEAQITDIQAQQSSKQPESEVARDDENSKKLNNQVPQVSGSSNSSSIFLTKKSTEQPKLPYLQLPQQICEKESFKLQEIKNSLQSDSQSNSSSSSSKSSSIKVEKKVPVVTAPQETSTEILKLLTQSEINGIKRQIGQVLLNYLKQATIRIILQKAPHLRTEKEYDRIISLLKSIPFFKQTINGNKQLSYTDFRDLAQLMTYTEYEAGKHVYRVGDTPDNFYVILNGQVKQKVRNPVIYQWHWAYSIYEALTEWKEKEFDPKVIKIAKEVKEKAEKEEIEDDDQNSQRLTAIKRMKRRDAIKDTKDLMHMINKFQDQETNQKTNNSPQNIKHSEGNTEATDVELLMKNWQSHKFKKLKKLIKPQIYDNLECHQEIITFFKYLNLSEQEVTNLKQLHRFKMFKWWNDQQILNRGDCFGEAAFQSLKSSEIRQEEIQTTEKTGLAVLSKSNYFRVLRKFLEKNSVDKKDFIQKIPLFKDMNNQQIQNLFKESTEESYKLNQFVYHQRFESKHIYIILSGEFEILRQQKVKISNKQGVKIHQINDPGNKKQFENTLNRIKPQNQNNVKNYSIRISLCSSGHVLAWDDVLEGRPYTTSVKCKAADGGTLLKISREVFMEEVFREKKVLQRFVNCSEMKSKVSKKQILQYSQTQHTFRQQTVEKIIEQNRGFNKDGNEFSDKAQNIRALFNALKYEKLPNQLLDNPKSPSANNKACLNNSQSSLNQHPISQASSKLSKDKHRVSVIERSLKSKPSNNQLIATDNSLLTLPDDVQHYQKSIKSCKNDYRSQKENQLATTPLAHPTRPVVSPFAVPNIKIKYTKNCLSPLNSHSVDKACHEVIQPNEQVQQMPSLDQSEFKKTINIFFTKPNPNKKRILATHQKQLVLPQFNNQPSLQSLTSANHSFDADSQCAASSGSLGEVALGKCFSKIHPISDRSKRQIKFGQLNNNFLTRTSVYNQNKNDHSKFQQQVFFSPRRHLQQSSDIHSGNKTLINNSINQFTNSNIFDQSTRNGTLNDGISVDFSQDQRSSIKYSKVAMTLKRPINSNKSLCPMPMASPTNFSIRDSADTFTQRGPSLNQQQNSINLPSLTILGRNRNILTGLRYKKII